ncbi:MAG TPA: histidinol-phosphatase [Dongiaceae bacterium]|nr:histidinol-phosphatase [Dongiaceae bacterium]
MECPAEFVSLAERLADASGRIVRHYFRSAVEVITKADRSPVTIADREAEKELRRMAALAYPGHGLLGEELPPERPDAEYAWVFDPIDGTKSFITGRPLFGTLIALLHRGRPILGVIDHPALGERWIGAAGRPTTFQGKPVHVRACADLAEAVLAASTPHMFRSEKEAEAFHRVRRQARLTMYGGDCYAYGLLASGLHDLAIEANLGIHDFLPLVPVIEGAGGIVTDWDGRALGLDSGDKVLAAGDARLHRQALALLAG